MTDYVISRPDPLEMLEAWTQHEYDKLQNCDGYEEIIDFLKNLVYYQKKVIKQLRTNPAAVREQGIKDGWWK
jgi:predicted N-acyltransferase